MSVLKKRIAASDKEANLWINVAMCLGMIAAGQIAGAYPAVRLVIALLYLGAIAYACAPAAKACAENASSHYRFNKGITPWIPLFIPLGLSIFLFVVGAVVGVI